MIWSSWRTTTSGRSSRSNGEAMRSRRSSAGWIWVRYRPSSWVGARKTLSPSGPTTSEPPQKVIDSSTPGGFNAPPLGAGLAPFQSQNQPEPTLVNVWLTPFDINEDFGGMSLRIYGGEAADELSSLHEGSD